MFDLVASIQSKSHGTKISVRLRIKPVTNCIFFPTPFIYNAYFFYDV